MNFKTRIFNIGRLFFRIPFLENYLRLKMLKDPNSFIKKLIPNNYQYPINSYRIFKYNGVQLKADIRDFIGHRLYFGFKDDAHEQLMKLVKADFSVLDIGTNIGSTLLQFAKLVGKNGNVYGFEPDPLNYKNCVQNIELNHFNNVSVNNIGLGDEKGEFSLVIDTPTNRGGNRIQLDNPIGKESVKIKVFKLDDWINSAKITKVDLIKIDVEGFEMNVLKGGKETLKTYQPLLFIELDDNNLKLVGSSAQELVEFIENINYSIVNVETAEVVTRNTSFENCHFDIICRPL